MYEDLSDPKYCKAVLASGIIPIANEDDVTAFVKRYGDPDLMAGHPPVVVGLDTNLTSWRIDEILGLRDPDDGVGYVNGFVLATGPATSSTGMSSATTRTRSSTRSERPTRST